MIAPLRSIVTAIVVSSLITLVLAGCSQQRATDPAAITFTPSTALFDSNEAALTAAQTAYNDYLTAVAYTLEDSTHDTDALTAATTGELQRLELESVHNVRQSGQKSTGLTRVLSARLRHAHLDQLNAIDAVSIELCADVSDTQVFDPAGQLITKPDRPLRLPFEAHFDAIDGTLITASSNIAKEFTVCASS